MKVPFVDLKKQYLNIKKEIDTSIQRNINNTSFIGGSDLDKFSNKLSSLLGVKHVIPVANGTDAIYISLKMLGIGPGDEVITTAHSWISTSETISQTGAKPVFVDTNDYFCISPEKIESKITSRTKAIIPVHLYGHAADMTSIIKLAKRHSLYVIEDCAQAILTKWKNKYVGTIGDVGTISFFPGKNLGAFGDAGAIITNSSKKAKSFKMYASHGGLSKHEHKIEGINSRMDTIQAGILNVKMRYIKKWISDRQSAASLYFKNLEGCDDIDVPLTHPDCDHTFHLFVIKTKKRDSLASFLKKNGISTGIHYPSALPLLECYKSQNNKKSDFQKAYNDSKSIISLPIYPEITEGQIKFVSNKVKEFFSK